jgi:hypothetical protein
MMVNRQRENDHWMEFLAAKSKLGRKDSIQWQG